ncbi:MAG: cupin domain-containing protein [Candidatus Hodarchaeales archaeon]
MRKKVVDNITSELVTMYGSKETYIQWIWGKNDRVPHFAMRRFVIEPNGEIGLHNHKEEHEIFFLAGKGLVFNDSGEEFLVKANDALYVPPDEPHGYKNTGKEDLVFLCIIPLL